MHPDQLRHVFDQQAPGYDRQWAKLAPLRDALHLLTTSLFAALPADARVLCVGAGTGVELAHLAHAFPQWQFTAVDPSGAMLEQCRLRAEDEGILQRCRFHEGYVDDLPETSLHDAATSFLVSQFIVEREARIGFFRDIARRLHPGGLLATSDLASDTTSIAFEALVQVWMRLMASADVGPEAQQRMREAWKKDVAILPPAEVAGLVEAGGFDAPVQFHQAGLIHAWFARRSGHAVD